MNTGPITLTDIQKHWPGASVEMRNVADLLPYARNPRTHSKEQVAQIANSISEFGFTVPVLIGEDGVLIAGHGRVLAAKLLGLAQIPCMVAVGWTEAQRRAYVIADNKLTLNGTWDEDLLREELDALAKLDFDLDLTGFEAAELLNIWGENEGNTDPDEVPPAPDAPVSRLGDIWLLGAYFECQACKKKYPYEQGRHMEACPCDEK